MGISLKKVSDFLLGVEEDDYDDYEDEYYYEEEDAHMSRSKSDIENIATRRSGASARTNVVARGRAREVSNVRPISSNIVDMHKPTQIEISSPKNIDDARDIIDNIKISVISVVNLESVDDQLAQRVVDFLSGAVDALDGNMKRLSNDMFMITPSGVEITGALAADIDDSIKGSSLSLPWLSSVLK